MRIAKLDLNLLNIQLDRLETIHNQVATLQTQLSTAATKINSVSSTHVPSTSNNLQFTWTGSGSKISWPAGSVKDALGINIPVLAGSTNVSASTYYWLAWNKVHNQMVIDTNADNLLQNKNNTVICQLYTGTTGQSGVAGGGGSQSGVDLSGSRYKLF